MIGGQYFVGAFLENELAQTLEGYWTVTNWKALKRYKAEPPRWFRVSGCNLLAVLTL